MLKDVGEGRENTRIVIYCYLTAALSTCNICIACLALYAMSSAAVTHTCIEYSNIIYYIWYCSYHAYIYMHRRYSKIQQVAQYT